MKFYKNKYYLFSILYISFAILMTLYIWFDGRVEVNGTDAITQHFPAMTYISNYYRNFVNGLFDGQFVMPMYDSKIGLGEDILVTLNWYGLGNPLYILTAFFDAGNMIYFYTAFFYLQVYIGGMCLMLLAERIYPNKPVPAYVSAAFLYCSSGFVFESEVHIIFVHVLIYVPLILYAIDKVLFNEKKSKRLLIISTCFLAMSGFFFFYIISIGVVIFALLRWWNNSNDISFKDLVRGAVTYIVGLCGAAIVFIPEIIGFLQSNRVGGKIEIGLLYDFDIYKDMFYRMIFLNSNWWSMAALPVVGYLGIFILLISKGKIKERVLVISAYVLMGIPFVSWIMSGCSSVIYNRWEVLVDVLLCVMFVGAWDEICSMTWKKYIICIIAIVLFCVVGVIDGTIFCREFRNAALGLVISVCVLAYIIKTQSAAKNIILACLIIGCAAVTWFTNGSRYKMSDVEKSNSGNYDFIIDSEEFYRIENGNVETKEDFSAINRAMIYDYNATSEYWSILNGNILSAYDKWGLESNYMSWGIDLNNIYESLCAVKYIVIDKNDKNVPYGYDKFGITKNDDNIYVNKNWMPLGYLYSENVDYNQYAQFEPFQRMKAMTEVVAFKDYINEPIPKVIEDKNKDYVVDNALLGIDLVDGKEGDYRYILEYQSMSGYNSYLLMQPTGGNVYLRYPRGIVNQSRCFELGYSDENQISYVEFSSSVPIEISDLQVINLDMAYIDDNLLRLRNNGEVALSFENDSITGEVYSNDNAYLCVAIPFSKGWRAYIDGVEKQIYQANDLFLGLEIESGAHKVELYYCTPGLKIGFVITTLAIAIAVIWLIIQKRQQNRALFDVAN